MVITLLQTKRSPVLTLVTTKSFFFKKMYFECISSVSVILSPAGKKSGHVFFSKKQLSEILSKCFQTKKFPTKNFPTKIFPTKNFLTKKIQNKNFQKNFHIKVKININEYLIRIKIHVQIEKKIPCRELNPGLLRDRQVS